MPLEQDLRADREPRQETALGEAVSRNGVDCSAQRRAHMRELTTARQAAERLHKRPLGQADADRSSQLAAARDRALDLRTELARIDAEHRTWLHDQGEDVPELRSRQHKVAGTDPA